MMLFHALVLTVFVMSASSIADESPPGESHLIAGLVNNMTHLMEWMVEIRKELACQDEILEKNSSCGIRPAIFRTVRDIGTLMEWMTEIRDRQDRQEEILEKIVVRMEASEANTTELQIAFHELRNKMVVRMDTSAANTTDIEHQEMRNKVKDEVPSIKNLVPDRVPPTITDGPERYYIFQYDATVILPCKASGIPEPTYTWTKNDHYFDKNINNIIWTPGEGTIKIVNAGGLDVGEYRCFASNQWGTAMSVKAQLEMIILGTYPVQAPIKPYNGDPGGPMRLTCDSIRSIPTPGYSWVIYEEGNENSGKAVQMSKRVQMDDEGHLYFANLQSEDAEPGYIYKCNVYNPELQLTLGGSYSRIRLSGGTGGFSPPLAQTRTPNPYIALRGKEAKLKCIFSGNPTPIISWKRQGASLPFGRYFIEDEGTTLKITDVEQSDEGRYLCDAENALGQRTQEIEMKVEAEPVFVRDQDKPMSLNITEGGTAVFTCRADAIPQAVSQWYINGEKIAHKRPGPRRKISEDGSTLTITNVCKNCINEGDHNTDLMNIQCEGINDHNYAYADAFLNVFTPCDFKVYENQHASGAIRNTSVNTLDGCQDACRQNVTCTAIDFNFKYSRCWIHSTDASKLIRQAYDSQHEVKVHHYVKQECVTPPPLDATSASEGAIRLVNGPSPRVGRLEIFHNGQWGTVCDDMWNNGGSETWGPFNALVVCRQLGYSTVNAKFKLGGENAALYGRGSGPIWLDAVKCDVNKSKLHECSHRGWGVHNCDHGKDVGVICEE